MWNGLGSERGSDLRIAVRLAQAVVDGSHEGMDYRTFSRRVVGDSKALENLESLVVQLVGRHVDLPPAESSRAILAALGVERFAPPFLVSGSVKVAGASLSKHLPYIGFPPSSIGLLEHERMPDYVLTIENFASFNRHISEADPERRGTTIYVGGYPALGTQEALSQLRATVPAEVPFYHWSDIDPDGTWIFSTVAKACGGTLLPHLMTPQLAEKHGELPKKKTRPIPTGKCPTEIRALAEYLSRPDAKVMEQEQIDPALPTA